MAIMAAEKQAFVTLREEVTVSFVLLNIVHC